MAAKRPPFEAILAVLRAVLFAWHMIPCFGVASRTCRLRSGAEAGGAKQHSLECPRAFAGVCGSPPCRPGQRSLPLRCARWRCDLGEDESADGQSTAFAKYRAWHKRAQRRQGRINLPDGPATAGERRCFDWHPVPPRASCGRARAAWSRAGRVPSLGQKYPCAHLVALAAPGASASGGASVLPFLGEATSFPTAFGGAGRASRRRRLASLRSGGAGRRADMSPLSGRPLIFSPPPEISGRLGRSRPSKHRTGTSRRPSCIKRAEPGCASECRRCADASGRSTAWLWAGRLWPLGRPSRC